MYQVKQLCCVENTHFSNRSHSGADRSRSSWLSCVGDWCPEGMFASNYDGVVRITYPEKPYEPLTEHISFIGDAQKYISEHNGINIDVDLRRTDRPEAKFNIITQGLGQGQTISYTSYFRPFIRKGTIMLVQVGTADGMDIVEELQKLNPHLTLDSGGLIYDASVWSLAHAIKTEIDPDRFAYSYLMEFVQYPNLKIWFANIHLKSYGTLHRQSTLNRYHSYELANIIGAIMKENSSSYPIYLCGDFNNTVVKAELVSTAAELAEAEMMMEIPEEATTESKDMDKKTSVHFFSNPVTGTEQTYEKITKDPVSENHRQYPLYREAVREGTKALQDIMRTPCAKGTRDKKCTRYYPCWSEVDQQCWDPYGEESIFPAPISSGIPVKIDRYRKSRPRRALAKQ